MACSGLYAKSFLLADDVDVDIATGVSRLGRDAARDPRAPAVGTEVEELGRFRGPGINA